MELICILIKDQKQVSERLYNLHVNKEVKYQQQPMYLSSGDAADCCVPLSKLLQYFFLLNYRGIFSF